MMATTCCRSHQRARTSSPRRTCPGGRTRCQTCHTARWGYCGSAPRLRLCRRGGCGPRRPRCPRTRYTPPRTRSSGTRTRRRASTCGRWRRWVRGGGPKVPIASGPAPPQPPITASQQPPPAPHLHADEGGALGAASPEITVVASRNIAAMEEKASQEGVLLTDAAPPCPPDGRVGSRDEADHHGIPRDVEEEGAETLSPQP
mmetsp:Transcript_65091/g.205729  ORF Transcript_65091/g.205729 Transcript_65091/m.205729 type:complete len:202 (+) Transcript_65091:1983-2588(+)